MRVERDVMYSLYIRNVGPESCVSELAILRDEALSTGSLSNMDPFKFIIYSGKIGEQTPQIMRSALSKHKERWLNFK